MKIMNKGKGQVEISGVQKKHKIAVMAVCANMHPVCWTYALNKLNKLFDSIHNFDTTIVLVKNRGGITITTN